jgi:hypothetical protein
MRTLLAIGTMSVLLSGSSPPRQETLTSRAEVSSHEKALPQTTAKPNETAKVYACSEAADREPSNQSGKKEPERRESSNVDFCLDLERPPSPMRECVRSVLREKAWSVPATKTVDAGLMAVRYLTSEELRRVAHTEIGGGRIQWEEGMVNAQIRLIPLSENLTQARIRTRILAKGSTSLPLMHASPWWLLVSTGALEGDVLASLKTRSAAKP